jgi:hypothetical protein
MSDVRTVVTFQSAAFNTSEPKGYFINDCCYGDDVAKWLIAELHKGGIETDDEPGQEDFGWYFGFRVGETDYQLVLGHRPEDGPENGLWIGWLERNVGLFASIMGRRKHGIGPEAAAAIHTVLSRAPEVGEVRWHHWRDFDAGREEGAAEPTAG